MPKFAVVSTIYDNHFVRLFDSREDAETAARDFIYEEYDDQSYDLYEDKEDWLCSFQMNFLEMDEWLFIIEATKG